MILLPLLALQEIDLLMIGVLVSPSGVSASDLAAALPAEEMDPRRELLLEPDEKPMETYEMMGRLVRGPLTDSSPGQSPLLFPGRRLNYCCRPELHRRRPSTCHHRS
jgi:hypothetical protein